jgi:hypothetical protein
MKFRFPLNQYITFFILVLTIFVTSCRNSREVLAEYKNGNKVETIQRKDLQFIVKLNDFQKKEDLSVAIQSQIVEELVFLSTGKLAYESLPADIKSSLEKEIKKSLLMLDEKAFMNSMNLILQEKSSNFVYKLMNMQLLFLKKDEKFDRSQEANQILNQLNQAKNEEEIEKIIFEKKRKHSL